MSTRPAADEFDPGKAGLVRLALTAPPLPTTLLAARSIMVDTREATADRVLDMVRNDPVVVAQLLRIANAAHYGSQRTVDSVRRAVDMLGPVTVLGAVTGMTVLRGRSPLSVAADACYLRLIRHSIATAHLAEIVFDHVGARSVGPDTVFTAGLLHDLGKILLVYHAPDHATAVFERPGLILTDDAHSALEIEQLAFGHDHTEAGEYVARKLDLPDSLVDVVRRHHAPEAVGGRSAGLVRIVAAADVAASALGFAFSVVRSWEQCVAHPVWALLGVDDPSPLLGILRRAAADRMAAVDAHVRPPLTPRAGPGRPGPRSPRTTAD